jgi:hypothetical protein
MIIGMLRPGAWRGDVREAGMGTEPVERTRTSEHVLGRPKASARHADPVTGSPVLDLQSKVGNRAVSRLLQSLPHPGSNVVARSPASDLVDEHTSWNNLDEEALGWVLLTRARSGEYRFVQETLDELGRTDRDDVSKEFTAAAGVADLEAMVATAPGRALVDRLYDELTGGSVAAEEQTLASRLLDAKAARMDPRTFAAAMTSKTTKVFPYRLPGFTVLDDAAVLAERRPEGRIWVRQMARVAGTPMFRAETATLPAQLFTSRGIELPEDEIVGVRMYDLGGVLVYRPALILVSLANESLTNNLTKIAEIVGIGLTLGTGALAGLGVEATMAARVLLLADRGAFALSVLTMVIKEHRGEILAEYGEDGQRFLNAVDYVSNATAVYGFARVALTMPSLAAGLSDAYRQLRGTRSAGSIEKLATETEALLKNADDIAAARTPATPGAQGGGTAVPEGSVAPRTGEPRPGPAAAPPQPPTPAPAPKAAPAATPARPAPPAASPGLPGAGPESLGAAPRGASFQSASAKTPRSVVTAIRADVAESQAYIQARLRGEIGLQRPSGANVKGTDFITARTRPDGTMEVIVTDVKASTVGKFPKPSTSVPREWMAEVNAAVAPGRLKLGNPALEAQIRAAVSTGRVVLRQVNVNYAPTPQGQGSMTGF